MNKAWTLLLILLTLLSACRDQNLNNPHPRDQNKSNIYYSSFSERPKTLDPAKSYSSNEYQFIAQIYEPPLQYHYLDRPFNLVPLASSVMPTVTEEMVNGSKHTVYRIEIQPGIYYAPHPAFAQDSFGKLLYRKINSDYLESHGINEIGDFNSTASRELIADDYIYEIKRLASPKTQSPILGFMGEHIEGLSAYAENLQKKYNEFSKIHGAEAFFDLRQYDLSGVRKIDRYTFEIILKDNYPQFQYWLAMPFFAPIPWEADAFYSQPGMDDHNISFDWYPVGTGPYQLTENNPNSEMILTRNPTFHGERYPLTGTPSDGKNGLLEDAGKQLPFIDQAIFRLEKEAVPRWNKFLQGYYDNSGISSDSFDQAINIDQFGVAHLTPLMRDRGIRLYESVSPSVFYVGFNMQDDVVGGSSERAKKLRQAISIALDYDEYISIFLNGRGIPAYGPIPPGIFGYEHGEKGINPIVYEWKNNRVRRRSLSEAKKLLAEAGYPNGLDKSTGSPLVLNYDVPAGAGPDDKAQFDWMRKQFAKIGIDLNIRATQYNRFQEKMRIGNAQIFTWGWHADYPDPENFFFLLYGPNGKVKYQGENAANYANPEFDQLFLTMKALPNGPERQAIIDKMLKMVREDSPWLWGFHPKSLVLSHHWNRVSKPNEIANNTLKYAKLDPEMRAKERLAWNQPRWWPLGVMVGLLGVSFLPVVRRYRREEYGRG